MKMNRTIILSVVLYGREIWSLTIRKEYRLRVFERRVLRNIFGYRKKDVTGDWRKLHSEGLNSFNSSSDAVRIMKLRKMR
jgi:hypothetical protein